MAEVPPLPLDQIINERGFASLPFQIWWQQLRKKLSDAVADITGKADKTTTITGVGDLGGGGDLSTDRTITHDDSGVTPGAYTNANITVNARGHVTAAASGSAGYTDEQAQDAVGTILTDTSTIDLTYNDGVPSITASIIAGSVGPTELASTTVTPGSYTNTDLTVDADGRITAASNGSGGSGSGVLPMVTGDFYPIFIHLDDGSLVYWEL